jgi:hypothetical protein
MKKPKLSLVDWASQLRDENLHHIGEYYCYSTGNSRYAKHTGETTMAFNMWMHEHDAELSSGVSQLLSKFEILRDWGPGFFLRRKRYGAS